MMSAHSLRALSYRGAHPAICIETARNLSGQLLTMFRDHFGSYQYAIPIWQALVLCKFSDRVSVNLLLREAFSESGLQEEAIGEIPGHAQRPSSYTLLPTRKRLPQVIVWRLLYRADQQDCEHPPLPSREAAI